MFVLDHGLGLFLFIVYVFIFLLCQGKGENNRRKLDVRLGFHLNLPQGKFLLNPDSASDSDLWIGQKYTDLSDGNLITRTQKSIAR